ncbi:MAG TPA: hypothetical protein VGL82_01890 [Bryobacteraceae bacterium]
MPRVRIVHWKPPQAGPLIEACRACGFEVEYDVAGGNVIMKLIRANPPDAIIIDLSCVPSHGRETAVYLRGTKYGRHIPLIFVDGEPEKVEIVRSLLPDAVFTVRRRVCAAVKSACAKPVADPVRPPGVLERYGSRTVAQKLGIKERSTVGVIDAPRDYVAALGELPANAEILEDPDSPQAVTLWFVRDPRVYQAGLRRMQAIAGCSKLWVIWRKGSGNGLTQYLVRDAAIEAGLVDYKICAVNEQWSAMAFARRKS